MKKAFTLAEIMIVLTIIGILTAILMPIAFQSSPDQNVMKFQKVNSTLISAVRDLVTSERYYLNGDLGLRKTIDAEGKVVGKKIGNSSASDKKYFCKTLEDVLKIKKTNCDTLITTSAQGHIIRTSGEDDTTADEEFLDQECLKAEKDIKEAQLILSDGIAFYEMQSEVTFGKTFTDASGNTTTFYEHNNNGVYTRYKGVCIDVDGIKKGEAPFGYGIRVDGRVFVGKRAQEWSKKSIHKGN